MTDAASTDRPLRVLAADDSSTNRLILTRLLEGLGHMVETAAGGEEAVAAAAREPFDVVLMDVQMPEVDGLEASRRIRALPGPGRATPIIAVTADASEEQSATYRTAGMDGLVAKPINPMALGAEIARVVAGAR